MNRKNTQDDLMKDLNNLIENDEAMNELISMKELATPIIEQYKGDAEGFKAFIGALVVDYFDSDYKKARQFLEDIFKTSYDIELHDKELRKLLDSIDDMEIEKLEEFENEE